MKSILKRPYLHEAAASSSSSTAAPDDVDSIGNEVKDLQSKNKKFSQELFNLKQKLSKASKEYESVSGKCREMETLGSIIQRSWAQLDIDVCMLLDCLGDSEFLAQNNDCPEVLYLLLQSHLLAFSTSQADGDSSQALLDHSAIAHSTAPAGEIKVGPETVRLGGLETAMDVAESSAERSVVANYGDLESTVISNLAARADFTLAAFERLCVAVSEASALPAEGDKPSQVNCISDAREVFAERGILIERVKSLSMALVDSEIKVQLAQKTNAGLQRELYRKKEEEKKGGSKAADATVVKSSSTSSSSKTQHEASECQTIDDVAKAGNDGINMSESRRFHIKSEYDKNHSVEKELSEQLEELTRNLKHSELAKTKLELEVNNRITKPVDAIEENILMQQKAFCDMNIKHKETIFGMMDEINSIKEKIISLKQKLIENENKTVEKCKEVVKSTEADVQEKRAMLEEARRQLVSLRAEYRLEQEYANLRNLLTVSQQMAAKEAETLQEKVRKNEGNKKLAEFHLESSKERIKCIELFKSNRTSEANNKLQLLSKRKFVLPPTLANSKIPAATPAKSVVVREEGECSDNDDDDAPAPASSTAAAKMGPDDANYIAATKPRSLGEKEKFILSIVQMRGVEMEAELHELRLYTDQLINEIEEVALQSSQTHEQAIYIKEKLLDTSKHVDIMDSNIILKSELESAKKQLDSVEANCKKLQSSYDKNTTAIYDIRQSDLSSADELNNLRKNSLDSHDKPSRELEEDVRLRCDEKKAAIIESLVLTSEKRNTLLRNREEQLSKAVKREEVLRTSYGSATEQNRVSRGSSDTILDITLKMIRCGVCNVRNKSMIISRCFHLLCKECVDACKKAPKNMKCPTCNERFFKDDIKTVYFTS